MRRILAVVAVLVLVVVAAGVTAVVVRRSNVANPRGDVASAIVTVGLDGRRFEALVVRPRRRGSFPVVGFAHGFLQGPQRYRPLFEAIAARGYIVIGPDTQTGPAADPPELVADLWAAIRWAQTHEPDADPMRSAVSGHSMGGGAAVQTLAEHPQITTAITLAPAASLGGWEVDAAPITAATATIVGTDDRIVPIDESERLVRAQRGPSTTYVIAGGSHCGFVGTIGLAGIPCDFGGISADRQSAITAGIVTAWLDHALRGGAPVRVPAEVRVRTRAARPAA